MVEGTQLRARRTRLKILRALESKNGSAGFSEIKLLTGLSTGSIYYNLERMKTYVTKRQKQYELTREGRDFLRNVDTSRPWMTKRKGVQAEAIQNQDRDAENVDESRVSFAG
jgi:predicted transcriptional regulator